MTPKWSWTRILVSALLVTFVIVMVVNSIRLEVTNTRIQQGVIDGTTCVLGNIKGREDDKVRRPDPEVVERACERYERRVDDLESNLDMR